MYILNLYSLFSHFGVTKKNERENEPGQYSQEAKERERERDPWSSAHASWSLLRGEREDVTLTCVSIITVAHVAAFSLASETKRA